MQSLVVMATVLACGAAACGSLVDGDYAGDPLLRLQGVATARMDSVTTAGAKAAALWQSALATGTVNYTPLPLDIEFPAFWVDILELPHGDAMLQLDPAEPSFAEAYLHIVGPGIGPLPRAEDFLATDYQHVLVHVAGALVPTSLTASYLGGALSPGFHVMVRTEVAELSPAQQVLVERCVALATGVPAVRARATCTVQHLYRLAPAPDDLATIWSFRLEAQGP